jgi:hypothetical protein
MTRIAPIFQDAAFGPEVTQAMAQTNGIMFARSGQFDGPSRNRVSQRDFCGRDL